MLLRLLLALGCCGLLNIAVAAEPDTTPRKPIAIRKISTDSLPNNFWDYKKKVDQPLIIESVEQLEKDFDDKGFLAKVKLLADLSKDRLIVFTWSGSGGDKLELVSGDTMNMGNTTFAYKRGLTRDLRQHTHIYVMPQGTKFDVQVPK